MRMFLLIVVLAVLVGGCIPATESERVQELEGEIEQLTAERDELSTERDNLQNELTEVKAGAIQDSEDRARAARRWRASAAAARVCDRLPGSPPLCDRALTEEGQKALEAGFTPSPWALTGLWAAVLAAFVAAPVGTGLLMLIVGWRAFLAAVAPRAEQVRQAKERIAAADQEIAARRAQMTELEQKIQGAEDRYEAIKDQETKLRGEVERMEAEAESLRKAIAAMR